MISSKTLAVMSSLVLSASAFAQTAKPIKKPHLMRTHTAEQTAEKKMAAAATAPATQVADPAAVPTYPPAFDAAEKAMERYKVAPGFKMTVFAAEPQLANPVAFTIDDQGRFWVCETFRFDGGGNGWGVYDIRNMYDRLDDDLASKTIDDRMANLLKWNHNDLHSLTEWPDRLRLIEDRNGDGKADYSSVFAQWKKPLDGLASGVITRRTRSGEDIYVTNIPSLYRLRDTNNDGVADQQDVLSTGYGVRYSLLGHDLHGLRWGPDGKLYFSIGDRGLHVVTKEGKTLDYPDEGSVLRCDPDGSNLEVFAHGLRNPQELVFDKYGNLFAGDNNADYGEPARWVYIVEGSDSGWRIGYQHIRTPAPGGPWLAENLTALAKDNTAAYLIPPVAHVASGPSGNTYNPGTGLPAKYDDHFFLTDFRAGPSSLIHCFAMKPMGASFKMVDHTDFENSMVATDVEFGPDSCLYVTDWNASWAKSGKGRIYRIADPDLENSPQVLATKKLLNDGMFDRTPAELQALLAHRDMRVRLAAQHELAARGMGSAKIFDNVARSGPNQLARIHGIWGLGELAYKSDTKVLDPIVPLLSDSDPEIRAQAAKVLADHRYVGAFPALTSLLKDDNARCRFFAAMALGKSGDTRAVEPILQMLRENADKDAYLRHAGVFALVQINDMSALMAASKDPSAGARMGVLLAMRELHRPEVAMYLHDADVRLVTEAARAINDAQIEAAQPELASMLGSVTLPQPVILRALNANFRLGAQADADRVAAFAARGDAPELLRIEAIKFLKEWAKPRGIDEVVGIWRPYNPPTRDPSIAKKAAEPVLASIITSGPDSVRLAGIDLAGRIGVDDPNVLHDLVVNSVTPPNVAAAALLAMEAGKDPRLNETVDVALASGKGDLRTTAIRMLSGRADAVEKFDALLSSGSVADQQAVLDSLGAIDTPAAQQILATWMDKLIAGKVAPPIQLDLLEAAGKSKSDAVRSKLKQYTDSLSKADPLAAYRQSLEGGDPALGSKIFHERQDVACLRCHKIDGTGGIVGPDLTGVGSRHDRTYLLESIVDPSAKIAPGFESIVIQMKGGRHYTGIVKSDTGGELILDDAGGVIMHVEKSQIASRTKGMSAMPQNISQSLSKRDLRDLVAYLASLKQPATTAGQSHGGEK